MSCFKAGGNLPLWSKAFPSAGKVVRPGAFLLWAAGAPPTADPDVQPLTFVGDDILVCAGPVQDLVCLKRGTGEQRWRVERIGEYERGFTGPSSWQYAFVRSTPLPTGPLDEEVEKKEEKQKKDEKPPPTTQHSIIGGPVVVDVPVLYPGDTSQRIFVAVAKAPRTSFREYISDCVIYELDSEGEPLAMVNLPRMVRGGRYQVQKDAVVWACQGGAFVKVAVSHRSVHRGFGPGGSDLLCRVAWYRHVAPEQPNAWLMTAPAGDPLAFGNEHAFRVSAGGYVIEPDAGVYHFPLSMVHLKTGAGRTLVLRVPYKGKLPEPETNYSGWRSPQGDRRIQARTPHILAITQLQVEGQRLRVTLGMKEWARSLEFQIDELQDRGQK